MHLNEIITLKEAAEIWGMAPSSLRDAINRYKKFKPDEYRKSGGVWLIKKISHDKGLWKPSHEIKNSCKP